MSSWYCILNPDIDNPIYMDVFIQYIHYKKSTVPFRQNGSWGTSQNIRKPLEWSCLQTQNSELCLFYNESMHLCNYFIGH